MRRILVWLAPVVVLLLAATPARAVAPGWAQGASLTTGRDWHSATLLGDGSVLIAGGYALPLGSATQSAERYFPATNTWASAGDMVSVRRRHVAVLLGNGKVLVAGGTNAADVVIGNAELYDPATNSWSGVPGMTPRFDATASLLPDGKVLVAGGFGPDRRPTGLVEVFNPGNNSWSGANGMPVAHGGHATTTLPGGDILITGGRTLGSSEPATGQVDRYIAATGTWSPRAGLGTARAYHEATLLANGNVLVSGGDSVISPATYYATAEVYNPATNAWKATGPMLRGRSSHGASLLFSGRVLVSGGGNGTDTTEQSTELYDPATDAWTSAGNMAAPRHSQGSTLLPNGRVFISGGWSGRFYPAPAELYTAPTTVLADPAVTFDDVVPGAAGGGVAQVRNTGDTPLLASGFALGGSFGGDYAITSDGCTGVAVPTGGACAIGLRFAPGAVGVRGATLTFEANTAAVTHGVSLIGRGVAPVVVPGPAPAPLQKIVVTLSYKYDDVTSKSTRLAGLRVKGVPNGATVAVACKKGCLRKKLTKRNVRGNVTLGGFFTAKKKVKAGTKIVVTVSAPNMISAIKTLTVRKRKAPQVTTRCQAPGQAKPAAC